MSPRIATQPLPDQSRRHGVLGALAAALPDRSGRRGEERRPELRVVRPVSRRRRTWQVGTIAGGLLFLAMFVIVGAQTLIVQQQRHIDDVNDRIAAAEVEAEQLKIELAELRSPERILSVAQDELGMVKAPPPVYLTPRADDDTRAAEVPPASPSTTLPEADGSITASSSTVAADTATSGTTGTETSR